MTIIDEARAVLAAEAQLRFEEWLRPDGKTVDVELYQGS